MELQRPQKTDGSQEPVDYANGSKLALVVTDLVAELLGGLPPLCASKVTQKTPSLTLYWYIDFRGQG